MQRVLCVGWGASLWTPRPQQQVSTLWATCAWGAQSASQLTTTIPQIPKCGNLPLTKISRNATGNLRACGGVRFRKFPWKFATAGGRVATRRGNSQTSTGMLVARRPIVALDQLLPSPTFRCLLVGRNTSRPGAESGFVRGICSTSVLKGWVLLVLPSER